MDDNGESDAQLASDPEINGESGDESTDNEMMEKKLPPKAAAKRGKLMIKPIFLVQ